MADDPQARAENWQASSFAHLFESSEFADCLIKCGDREFKAHKVILAAQCSFFAGCFKKGFAEGESGIVILVEDQPDTVQIMLRFLYSRSYYLPRAMDLETKAALHAEVYALAQKYHIPPLAIYAKENFTRLLEVFKDRVADGYLACVRAAEIVYTKTPDTNRGLRDVLITGFTRYHGELSKPENESVLEGCPKYCIDIVKQHVKGETHILKIKGGATIGKNSKDVLLPTFKMDSCGRCGGSDISPTYRWSYGMRVGWCQNCADDVPFHVPEAWLKLHGLRDLEPT